MKYYIITTICLLLSFDVFALSTTNQQVNDALKLLDKEVAKHDIYISNRQAKIDSLNTMLSNSANKDSSLSIIMSIGDEYVAFNNDSTIFYYNKGLSQATALGNDSLASVFNIKRTTYLPLAGFISDAVNLFESIDTTSMGSKLKELYHESGKQMYSYISSFYSSYQPIKESWHNKSLKHHISLLSILDKNSKKHQLYLGEFYLNDKQYSKSKAILNELINSSEEHNNLFARATHTLATIADIQNNENERILNLALSSIADIRTATLEVASMQELGEELLNRGDINRAYRYSSIALANAVKCKATMRMIQTSEAMPVIEQAHTAETKAWNSLITYLNISIGILTLSLILVLIYLQRRMKRLNQLRENLKHANGIKEIYISQFLNLCSIYMDKLNQFSNIVNRKISTGKAEDLYKITKSGKFIEEQSKEFYDVFDNAFLNIYPNFIEKVNGLLSSDQQITLTEDEKLNTDLRILALMRLGIEDSSRIAQMLNYSVNTIYAYKNKLKNRAINREHFEENIMKIESIS